MKTIELTRGFKAIVDDDDFEWLDQFKWYIVGPSVSGKYYVARRSVDDKSGVRQMQYEVLCRRPGLVIDHKNRDGLDNRKANLRWATQSSNTCNRDLPIGKTGYRGVWKNGNGFTARINKNKKRHHLGQFSTAAEAAAAYNEAAKKLHGEFAMLNPI